MDAETIQFLIVGVLVVAVVPFALKACVRHPEVAAGLVYLAAFALFIICSVVTLLQWAR